jgi:hypothetical protein
VDEHGHLLVNGIGREEELALVLDVLLDVLVAQALEVEREACPDHERAGP